MIKTGSFGVKNKIRHRSGTLSELIEPPGKNKNNQQQKNYKSIFRQFLMPVMLIVILLVTIIIAEIYMVFTDHYEKQAEYQNSETAGLIAKEVETFLDMTYRISEELSVNSDIVSMQTDRQTPVLVKSAERNDFVELYYIQGMDGMQTGRSSGELADRSTRWWFRQMMETKQPFISKSYYSVNTNMPCASVFLPIEKDGEMIGVFATDIKLSSLQELIEKSSADEEEKYSFIIDGEGVVAAHPDNTFIEELYNYKNLTRTVSVKDADGRTVLDADGNVKTEEQPIQVSNEFKAAVDAAMAGNQGFCKAEYRGERLYVSYSPIRLEGVSDSWSVLTVQTEASAMTIRDRIVLLAIITGLGMLCLALLLIFILTKRITIPIGYARKMTERMAQGNFDEISGCRSKNEIGVILDSLNGTAASFRDMMEDITQQLNCIARGDFTSVPKKEYTGVFGPLGIAIGEINDKLNYLLTEIHASSSQVAIGAQAVSNEASGLAGGAAHQNQLIQSLEEAVENMSAKIRDNEEKAASGQSLSAEMTKDASRNKMEMDKLMDTMQEISKMSEDISRVVQVIEDISLQTNILALNAAVEATRAGSSGKGFGVVAEEVRNLAAKSADAARQTAELIDKTVKAVQKGARDAQMAAVTLEQVADKTVLVDQYIKQIAQNSMDEKMSIENVKKNIDGIAEVVAGNSRSAQNSAASSEKLSSMSDTMLGLIGKFRLK